MLVSPVGSRAGRQKLHPPLWPRWKKDRTGQILVWLLAVLLVSITLIGYIAYSMSGNLDAGLYAAERFHPVVRGDFEYFLTERGTVESVGSVLVRCQVRSQGTPGVAILRIHPEGENVKKGDFLVQFDDSLFQHELTLQEIIVAQSEALVIQAESDLRTAEITLEEYVSGSFEQLNTLIESEVFVARENVRRSEEYLKFSESLASKGYVTQIRLDADRFAVLKANTDLRSAEQKLSIHTEYTYNKMVVQLESEVAKLKANLRAAENTLSLYVRKRDDIQQQIEIGSNNDKFVIVREGLQEGTLVASNADDYRELVSLPPASSEDSQIEDMDEFAQWSDQLSLNDSPPE